ncbi:MAG: ABC transporter substrate-binding protein [Propionibacteriaceae bacterium]|jgi:NitT/TauT family transport system substrate-binding protein|nr:ABC transporter substrate-binding protein [Propionibacteriaceae bacterium]
MNETRRNKLRRLKKTLLAGGLLLAFIACSSEQPLQAETQLSTTPAVLTVGLTYQPDIQFAPFYVADALGWATEAEHATFQLRHHGMSESLFGALASGTEDLIVAGGDEMYVARGEGVAVTAIMTLYRNYPVALIVPQGSYPHPELPAAAALEAGMSVGIPGPYGENWYYLKAVLANYGLSETDIEIVHIGYTQQAALLAGRVAAVVGFVNNDVVRLQRAGMAVTLVDATNAHNDLALIGASLGASQQLLDNNSAALQEYVDIIKRAIEYVAADPQRAVDIAAAYVPGLDQPENRQAALDTLTATIALYGDLGISANMCNLGAINVHVWQAQASFLTERGLAADTPATAAYSTAFAGVCEG